MIRGTIAVLSHGPHNGIVTLRVPREQLEQLHLGQHVELVLPSSLPASPSAEHPAVAADRPANGSEGGLELAAVPAAEVPTTTPTATPAPRSAGVAPGASWDVGQRSAFRDSLTALKLGYRPATDAIEAAYGKRPSAMDVCDRMFAVQWLESEPGKRAYDKAVRAREELTNQIRATPRAPREAALQQLGLTGKSPSALSVRQMRAVVERVATLPPGGPPADPTHTEETQP